MMNKLRAKMLAFFLLTASCAGWSRECSSTCAGSLGADWVIVQYEMSGKAFRCWELHGASVVNEPASDGVYWEDPKTGNLVHISGVYNRVQVSSGRWEDAYKHLGLSKEACASLW